MSEVVKVASSLTEAEKKALLNVSTTHYRKLSRKDSVALGPHLRWKLLDRDGSDYTVNPFGLQVRAAVTRAGGGE